jgi:2-dehydro-3-deoxyphosphogluconate aldolase / (4S)-4-hydroxy-2-oxoglutarate aldolase
MTTLSRILEHKIVAIIRGVEVTMNSANALELINELSGTMKDKMQVGAGTVLDAETAKSAIGMGAKFIISPCLNMSIIKTTKQLGAVSIPGAFTPTEIVNAFNSGADIIKVFPASGNVGYIKEVRAPLSHIPLMPTGGITLENIGEFYKAGAIAFGIGTALVNTKEKVTDVYLKQLTERARQFVQAITNLQ